MSDPIFDDNVTGDNFLVFNSVRLSQQLCIRDNRNVSASTNPEFLPNPFLISGLGNKFSSSLRKSLNIGILRLDLNL